MIEPSTRLTGVEALIDKQQYFVIHAARQSGKTTYLINLAEKLNAGGKYYAICCSLEGVQMIADREKGIPAIVNGIKSALKYSKIPNAQNFASDADFSDFAYVLKTCLMDFCYTLDKPLVMLFDEVDCLSDETLISFLRQLRDGHNNRAVAPFVHSIALVGMRNIRDYKARIRPDSQSLGSASPFNVIAETYTLKNFTKAEIIELYQQHTDETGQVFEEDAIEWVWRQTQGQPWLVNAIAYEVVFRLLQDDFTQPVTADLVEKAIQTIILRRDTHIDSLLERLKEERVRKVIEPIMTGDYFIDRFSDDYMYVKDLGLITDTNGRLIPSNPIYNEVIARTLSYSMQETLLQTEPKYQMPRYFKEGRIDMDFLMRDFQQFWRENSAIWLDKFDYFNYKEAAPHLILMAFLQRVINGGGQIVREMAAGVGRLDLCVLYEGQKYPIELKVWRGEKTLRDGLEQTANYMDVYGCSEGWLAVFDRRPDLSWDEKIYMKKETTGGKTITIVGL